MKRILFFLSIIISVLNSQGAFAQVSVIPSVIHFDNQGDSTSSNPVQVTFTNLIETGPISITSMAFSTGLNFTLSNNTCLPLPIAVDPLTSCTFEIAFSPVSIGDLSDTLTLTGDFGTQTVSVDGSGVGIVMADLNPSSLSFGSQVVGSPSSPQTVTITNTGTAELSVIGFVVGGENPANFTISNDSCIGTAVQPNETCQFSVVFAPLTLISSSSAYLSILSDASNDVPLIPLTGGESTPFYDGGCSLSQKTSTVNFSLVFDLSILAIVYLGIRKIRSKSFE